MTICSCSILKYLVFANSQLMSFQEQARFAVIAVIAVNAAVAVVVIIVAMVIIVAIVAAAVAATGVSLTDFLSGEELLSCSQISFSGCRAFILRLGIARHQGGVG